MFLCVFCGIFVKNATESSHKTIPMEIQRTYEAPGIRVVEFRYEENILSGENTDITVTDPWSGLGEEDW